MLEPNGFFLLCWCQIVRFFILMPNCPFGFLVPNCPFLLSWCQIVWFQIVRVPNCPDPNCPVPNHPTTTRSPIELSWTAKNNNKIFNRNSSRKNLDVLAVECFLINCNWSITLIALNSHLLGS